MIRAISRQAFLRLLLLLLPLAACWKPSPGPAPMAQAEAPLQLVAQSSPGPATEIVLMVRAGSAHDRSGQEGLAWLSARLLREGGAGDRSPQQVEELLYRLGTDVQVTVDKELVTFRTRALPEDLPDVAELLGDMVLEARMDPAVAQRLRAEATEHLRTGLLSSDEELGQQVYESWLFEGHPYGHPVQGRLGSLPTLDSDDATRFVEDHYLRPAAVLGVAGPAIDDGGGFDPDAPETPALQRLHQRLSQLPARLYDDVSPRPISPPDGRELLVVQRPGDATGLHIGHSTDLGRGHPDWPAMLLATTALGEHRQSHGRLYRELRGKRGLNYGDYAYIEVYRQDGWSSSQLPGTGRVDNPFTVWIRPVTAENGAFALKAALSIVEDWRRDGLTREEFALVKQYLPARIALWADSPGRRLGWSVEARLMGWPDPITDLPDLLRDLELEQVNAAIRRHIRTEDLRIVAVTGDAAALLQALDADSPIRYGASPPPRDSEQARRDAEWAATRIQADLVGVLPPKDLFR